MAKRSIYYDELGNRMGGGRKPGRTELRSSSIGVDGTVSGLATQLAKQVVLNRHWREVEEVWKHEAAFLKELQEWAAERDMGLKGNLVWLIADWYVAHGMTRSKPAATSEATPALFLSSGRPRPQRRPR